jgi:membrane-associated phospholipid phosphatase
MNPFIIFDYIGHYGPIILFTVTFYLLLSRKKYLYVFVIGSIINNFMNIFLKNIFKEERPKNPLPFIDSNKLIKNNYYGLPSGHAQNTFFSLTFLYLTKAPIIYLYLMSCVTIITLYQRLKYRRHNLKQIIVGAFIGIFFAWVLIFTTKNIYIYTNNY